MGTAGIFPRAPNTFFDPLIKYVVLVELYLRRPRNTIGPPKMMWEGIIPDIGSVGQSIACCRRIRALHGRRMSGYVRVYELGTTYRDGHGQGDVTVSTKYFYLPINFCLLTVCVIGRYSH